MIKREMNENTYGTEITSSYNTDRVMNFLVHKLEHAYHVGGQDVS